jgi:hypothetical protein
MSATRPDITAQRADPFAVATEPDVSAFAPTPARKPPVTRETIREVSEKSDFPSRAPPPKARAPKAQRRRRTGRNVQFNIKARQETIDRFIKISEAQGWVFGETLDHALTALEHRIAPTKI